ncbi:hypothetical protein BU24DRAFT_267092 [Aaosphaeria arxii CBS 175.79]|uniref:Uncharacterized protein n=1 Tax=Aaosphaeria arxii CBS 175.79 TaxID=1450172 RepID=A0A6A5XGK2_9PLEO|nr:uncharacterized protein BU24DRAFT_267092 [Aaosphaeria arxii CBS 175.79]KAF2011967.1 hypothetical protein BU24DRAFT_267092 [Aaosphaeria arxii CBS 175.79]
MESDRSHLSITLPRNFMFHYHDEHPPRTPEPEVRPATDDLQPPPPPRQTLKVRRRRTTATIVARNVEDLLYDERPMIPTIEAPELHSDVSMDLSHLATQTDDAYLSPAIVFHRMVSPPKTPVSQMREFNTFQNDIHWSDTDHASQSESSSRPTSSSGFSDSSISSRESFESFPSLGGSCTSPEEDMVDPFSYYQSPEAKWQPDSSPLATQRRVHPQKKLKLKAYFTQEMDYHLWMTYLQYLQDPTVTPFKALPSTVPPNGVCHRVARMARKTWRGPRSAPTTPWMRSKSRFTSRNGTPDTIKPNKSGSNTPVPGSTKPHARFPTEKQCRKRLRDLAKSKPTLSAHYQRLLNHRSPSPFQSSPQEASSSSTQPPAGLSSPFSSGGGSTTFSTRDMNVSLAASTAASMQFGNPLSQLSSQATPRPAREARSSAHQKSQSLHIGLGLGIGSMMRSSFTTMSEMTDRSMNQPAAQTWHAPSARPGGLGSPLQLHAPRPISRPFRRRALHNFEEQVRNRGNSFVDQVFGAPAESSHRRVRSRGFSLGDMMEGARRAPPSTNGSTTTNVSTEANPFASILGTPQSLVRDSAAADQATIRLGSPFSGRPNNTFPRASTSYGFEPPASFEQRFAGLSDGSNRPGNQS